MRSRLQLLGLILVLALLVAPAPASASKVAKFEAVVQQILAEPYQPDYTPTGNDTAFPDPPVANTAPAQDYTTGSVDGNPDFPGFRAPFQKVVFFAPDGAKLYGWLALQHGTNPGIVVAHGFNTRGKNSVVRWAHMLAANGYNVLAADQRSFREYWDNDADKGFPDHPQTIGWKEAVDVRTAGLLLAAQEGVSGAIGLVGFSAGAQNTVLALGLDGALPAQQRVFDAGLTFSAPADQNTQIYSTAQPPNCFTPACTYPASGALIQLVVPPYTYNDPCDYFVDAAAHYGTTPFAILSNENAFRRQSSVRVPLLNFFAEDDALVQPFNATMMAGYNVGKPLQKTLMLERGQHAYFFDRWWQQRAILLYFKAMLPRVKFDRDVTTNATVNQTAGGAAAGDQLVDIGAPTKADADALLAPYICDTTQPSPGGS
jgi:predicted alpha/beta-fold hydrolase